jgi:hypothetical protein
MLGTWSSKIIVKKQAYTELLCSTANCIDMSSLSFLSTSLYYNTLNESVNELQVTFTLTCRFLSMTDHCHLWFFKECLESHYTGIWVRGIRLLTQEAGRHGGLQFDLKRPSTFNNHKCLLLVTQCLNDGLKRAGKPSTRSCSITLGTFCTC